MKRGFILFLILAALTALLLFFAPKTVIQLQSPTAEKELPAGYHTENDFTFRNPEELVFSLSDFAGRPVVVCFWATWNTECRDQLAVLDQVLADYKEDAVILTINVGKAGKDSLTKAESVITTGGYSLPIYVDQTGVISFNVTAVPRFLFVDELGNILEEVDHTLDYEQISMYLDGMLKETNQQ